MVSSVSDHSLMLVTLSGCRFSLHGLQDDTNTSIVSQQQMQGRPARFMLIHLTLNTSLDFTAMAKRNALSAHHQVVPPAVSISHSAHVHCQSLPQPCVTWTSVSWIRPCNGGAQGSVQDPLHDPLPAYGATVHQTSYLRPRHYDGSRRTNHAV